jgi:hypothetical protein
MFSSRVFLILLIIVPNFLIAQHGTEPVKLSDLLKVKSANSVTLSNDGKN